MDCHFIGKEKSQINRKEEIKIYKNKMKHDEVNVHHTKIKTSN